MIETILGPIIIILLIFFILMYIITRVLPKFMPNPSMLPPIYTTEFIDSKMSILNKFIDIEFYKELELLLLDNPFNSILSLDLLTLLKQLTSSDIEDVSVRNDRFILKVYTSVMCRVNPVVINIYYLFYNKNNILNRNMDTIGDELFEDFQKLDEIEPPIVEKTKKKEKKNPIKATLLASNDSIIEYIVIYCVRKLQKLNYEASLQYTMYKQHINGIESDKTDKDKTTDTALIKKFNMIAVSNIIEKNNQLYNISVELEVVDKNTGILIGNKKISKNFTEGSDK